VPARTKDDQIIKNLEDRLCNTAYDFLATDPRMKPEHVLAAIERIRFAVTEGMLERQGYK